MNIKIRYETLLSTVVQVVFAIRNWLHSTLDLGDEADSCFGKINL